MSLNPVVSLLGRRLRLAVIGGDVIRATGAIQIGVFRPHPRIIQTRGDGVDRGRVAVLVLAIPDDFDVALLVTFQRKLLDDLPALVFDGDLDVRILVFCTHGDHTWQRAVFFQITHIALQQDEIGRAHV